MGGPIPFLFTVLLSLALSNVVFAQEKIEDASSDENLLDQAVEQLGTQEESTPKDIEEVAVAIPVEKNIKEEETDLVVGIDEVEKLDFDFSTKVQIGNESILKLIISPQKGEILFRGLRPGKTSVTIRDKKGEIRKTFLVNISSTGLSKTVADLRELLGNVEGLEIGIKGGKVVVDGEIIVSEDMGRISAVLGGYENVLNLVELSPQTQRVIARKMQDELNRSGLNDVRVRVVNKSFWLEGIVPSNGAKELALEIAKAYLPFRVDPLAISTESAARVTDKSYIIDFLVVEQSPPPPPPPEKMIKITTQFVELSKGYNRAYGFNWSPLLNTGDSSISINRQGDNAEVSSSSNGIFSATISNLIPKLSALRNSGHARIIQSGMVITKNNVEGNINKTREINFAIGGNEFTRSVNITEGFAMNVTPRIIQDENVEMSIALSVNIPGSRDAAGTPTAVQNSVKTQLAIKNRESAVIGGVVQDSTVTDYDKDPSIQESSPAQGSSRLFVLVRRKDYNQQKNQFVVFVTPEIVTSASTGVEEVRKKFRRRSR